MLWMASLVGEEFNLNDCSTTTIAHPELGISIRYCERTDRINPKMAVSIILMGFIFQKVHP